jgi:hypothetical protein
LILNRYWFIFSIINIVSLIIYLEFFILRENNNFDSYIYGQTSVTNSSGLVDESTNSSFNAEGTINTILYSQDRSNNTKPLFKDINTNHTSKYLLGGKWRVDILNNNLTYFKSNFTMIDTGGRDVHFHTIVYKPRSTQPLIQDQEGQLGILFKNKNNNTSGFNCNVDIYTNGVLEWENVPIKVTLMNEKVIMMDIKDKRSLEHFFKNPIYGLINSVDVIQQ